jgi:hypothetical protein
MEKYIELLDSFAVAVIGKAKVMNGTRESTARFERRALQVAVTTGSLVPISAGAGGVLMGPALLGVHAGASGDLDGHFRYLSGLLLGIGLAYMSAVPRIEHRGQRFFLLGCLVVLGGLGRLLSILLQGSASQTAIGALAMELLVTPSLTIWQLRIGRRR